MNSINNIPYYYGNFANFTAAEQAAEQAGFKQGYNTEAILKRVETSTQKVRCWKSCL